MLEHVVTGLVLFTIFELELALMYQLIILKIVVE